MSCKCIHFFNGNNYCMLNPASECELHTNGKCNSIRPIYGKEIFSPRWEEARNDFISKLNSQYLAQCNKKENELLRREQDLMAGYQKLSALRSKETCYRFVYRPGGRAYIEIQKENGSVQITECIEAIRGIPQIFILEFAEELGVKKDYFMIEFVESLLRITGEISKVSQASYLQFCFEKEGVNFPPTISKKKVSEALRASLTEPISNCVNRIQIMHLLGWNGSKKYNFPNDLFSSFGRLLSELRIPASCKIKEESKITREGKKRSVDSSRLYSNDEVGKLVFLLPYLAIISSLLIQSGKVIMYPVIFVCDDISQIEIIKELLMIFKPRGSASGIMSLREKKCDVLNFLGSGGDEILLFLASYEAAGDKYNKDKVKSRLHEVISIAARTEQLPSPYCRFVNSQVVVVSDFIPEENSAYTVEWNENFENVDLPFAEIRGCCIDFIGWVERNWQTVADAIIPGQGEYAAFSITYRLICKYYKESGLDIFSEPDWASILVKQDDCEDILHIFKAEVIKKSELSRDFLVDVVECRDYYAFPAAAWCDYMNCLSLAPYAGVIIKKLKNRDMLKTEDSSGNTYRITINGKREEHYLISKNFFDDLGELPFSVFIGRRN